MNKQKTRIRNRQDEILSQTAFNKIYMAAVVERERYETPWEKETEIVLWKMETVIVPKIKEHLVI